MSEKSKQFLTDKGMKGMQQTCIPDWMDEYSYQMNVELSKDRDYWENDRNELNRMFTDRVNVLCEGIRKAIQQTEEMEDAFHESFEAKKTLEKLIE